MDEKNKSRAREESRKDSFEGAQELRPPPKKTDEKKKDKSSDSKSKG